QVELLQQVVRPAARHCPGQVVEPADDLEVEAGAEQSVDRGLLGGHADTPLDLPGLRGDIEPGYPCRAFGRLGERGEDADGRGLAGTVVAQETEHGSGLDLEVEVAKGPQIAEPLAQVADRNPGFAASSARMLYRLGVHSTSNFSSTMYVWQPEIAARGKNPRTWPAKSPGR